ncbi:YmfQ family protein [Methylobacterium durans]|uniref:Phage tail protein n=1 Tax=Methylobacterium durans TaxID=2202825 RepID=A0A2U8WAJ5_9HYPH|nr:putative phage tail protein [Methylobacterium durans]AWN43175.1 hypothetical protein DK389_25110 [Methylobacterium durans]
MPEAGGYARHDGEDYAYALAALLPTGAAWPRDPKSALMQTVRGLGEVWGHVDSRAGDLVEVETDPRQTLELLGEWERAFGLPDPCVTTPLSVIDRRNALLNKMTALGGQSRAFFIGIASTLGYQIQIVEWSPYQGGISRAGDTRPYTGSNRWFRGGVGGGRPGLAHHLELPSDLQIAGPYRWRAGPPGNRAWWRVLVAGRRLSWFRGGSGQAGIDPHLRIMPAYRWFRGGPNGGNPGVDHHFEPDIAEDLECVFRRWKPAHTLVTFLYTGQPLSAY